MIYQDKQATCQAYLEKFQNCVDVLEHFGGTIGHVPGLVKGVLELDCINADSATPEEIPDATKATQEEYLTMAFLLGSNHNQYGKLIKNLENHYAQGQDRYPKTLMSAYSLLTNWKQDAHNIMRFLGPTNEGVSFVHTNGNEDAEHALNTTGHKSRKEWLKDRVNTTCHKCGQKGLMQTNGRTRRLRRKKKQPW
jgi:hypothetical protein